MTENIEKESNNGQYQYQVLKNDFGTHYPREGQHCLFKLLTLTPYQYEKKADSRNKALPKFRVNGVFERPLEIYGYMYSARFGKKRVYLPYYYVSIDIDQVEKWKPSGLPDYHNGYGREGEENRLIHWG